MTWAALCVVLLAAYADCSSVQFVSVPSSIRLPEPGASLRSSDLPHLNSFLLGLSSQGVKGFSTSKQLFSNPHAVAVVRVDGLDHVATEGPRYSLTENGQGDRSLEDKLALIFGANKELVSVGKEGITGSNLAQSASQQKVNLDTVKTKSENLRAELKNVYALAAALKAGGAKFAQSESADVYDINIQALTQLSEGEQKQAVEDITNAVNELVAALKTAYGDQVVVEVVSVSPTVNASGMNESAHHIVKRDAAQSAADVCKGAPPEMMNLCETRVNLNVYYFTSSDYPAIFAIFAGIVIALVLGVAYTAVGMMTMDPGRDSIIYRMTTTRMKKD